MGILRRIKKIKISRNPVDNTVDNLGSVDELHNQSDINDSLESLYFEEETNQHCGCFAAPGGRCNECGVISCVRCHQHCGGTDNPNPIGCGKPLCREHSHFLKLDDGQNLPFCKRCYGRIVRKERWLNVGKMLLDPFVDWEGDNER